MGFIPPTKLEIGQISVNIKYYEVEYRKYEWNEKFSQEPITPLPPRSWMYTYKYFNDVLFAPIYSLFPAHKISALSIVLEPLVYNTCHFIAPRVPLIHLGRTVSRSHTLWLLNLWKLPEGCIPVSWANAISSPVSFTLEPSLVRLENELVCASVIWRSYPRLYTISNIWNMFYKFFGAFFVSIMWR